MFPIALRPSKSDRSLTKLKKAKTNLSWSTTSTKAPPVTPEIDIAAFRSGFSLEQDHQSTIWRKTRAVGPSPQGVQTSVCRARCISTRNAKRDTILIDLTNNEEFAPALDYAFAILDAEDSSIRSLPQPPSPKQPVLSRSSSFNSCDISSASTFSPSSYMSPSVRSAPPRYVYVSSPLSSSSSASSNPSTRSSPQKCSATHEVPSRATAFDPHELSLALTHAQSTSSSDLADPPSPTSVPFPPPAIPPAARVPLLQRKPRLLHSADSSIDDHEGFLSRSCPGSSKVSLARSVSSLDHHRDVFASRGACWSTTSVNTTDSTLSALFACQPTPRTPNSCLKLFSSPKKSRPIPTRRASSPPPCRTRLGIPSTRPSIPALSEVLIGPAARREAISDSNSLLSRSPR